MRRKNPNALEWIKRQQVLIPCYEVGGTAADSQRKEPVVFRIAASGDFHLNIDPTALLRQDIEECDDVLFIEVTAKLPST